ncbi:hypothetical protein B0H14DRAFT_2621442 [Mycena olivaceomarginata]|nr:hypothetical protein B0H14DRAFT_2621442 [Mycena olivaceomarginata]
MTKQSLSSSYFSETEGKRFQSRESSIAQEKKLHTPAPSLLLVRISAAFLTLQYPPVHVSRCVLLTLHFDFGTMGTSPSDWHTCMLLCEIEVKAGWALRMREYSTAAGYPCVGHSTQRLIFGHWLSQSDRIFPSRREAAQESRYTYYPIYIAHTCAKWGSGQLYTPRGVTKRRQGHLIDTPRTTRSTELYWCLRPADWDDDTNILGSMGNESGCL